ncbi:hypothetical protein KBB96_08445 [Luteolibacter ambystomatis]|uniref:Ysc84 actin-binding domain-containing protein n=1 Tax=Luteolibacter ambystomatis TaxID=2824561 RepID=A0A975J2P3_9BACT|nr:YSC84-related protein [Luteolibacter ambystomatis]QUE52908.1 hypothetical protein KBB96_08445 [Luteolibacter ambystomatis]
MKATYLAAPVLAAASMLLSNCAHEPVTQANASNASGGKIAADSRAALNHLYAENPSARRMGNRAAGVLVFPHIWKGAFIYGAEGGNGTLFVNDRVHGFYQTAGGSWGLQAGLQKSGYALFMFDRNALAHLNDAAGWDVGSQPGLTIVDRGGSAALTAKTLDKGVYAYTFGQKGLMADVSIKGSKITRIHPGR